MNCRTQKWQNPGLLASPLWSIHGSNIPNLLVILQLCGAGFRGDSTQGLTEEISFRNYKKNSGFKNLEAMTNWEFKKNWSS